MHRRTVIATTGITGLIIGAVVWATLEPTGTQTVTPSAAQGAARTPAANDATGHYTTARAIADTLEAAGFAVANLYWNDLTDTNKDITSSWDVLITETPGPAPGDSGINLFRNHEAVTKWADLSKSAERVAVIGDTWAVSLASVGDDALALSRKMAPRIAQVLGGTVVE
ncbi:hypothetical protein NMG29_39150 [Streptomyces cocklensis]|uniref:Uncharacterized protein n=1 Tax=Actinacidiphila cocklensis TaxID=887465 RepID=A0A9W4DXD0_9ACTN|nr:hypothetical protein [Actinacidiphila cocklensis]MDD1064101.1 hypothetical protein [Actinacidiphila cocklensis]WSX75702.1 hypothetical protein OH826_18635 [Streptomyces sp. NBC_00899]CAG6395250.1 conserved hypothetical protein [Actinacidiphila cocklensis]